MPTPTFQQPQGQQSTAQLQDWIIKLVRDLNYLLENLDTVNINRLDAKVIIADTVTADKMNVTQLSAITADLGTITAGIIYGAYIATANGTYPRIEFSSAGNLLTAFLDATHHLDIIPNLSGTPALKFTTPSASGFLAIGSALTLQATGELDIGATTELFLQANNYIHIVGGWIGLKNETTGNTLQTDLDAKMSVLSGGGKIQSGSGSVVVATAGTGVTLAVSFPIAFATTPTSVVISIKNASVSNSVYINLFSQSPSTTGFTVFANSGSAQTIFFNWIAVGS